jgi:hypothetical protein
MHREILQPTGPFVDHIDGDRLNNQRANLREATRTENNCNSKMRKHNTSGHKGVYWHAQRGKWHAQVTLHGKTSSKLFADLEAAAEWASNERKRLHGAFASNG